MKYILSLDVGTTSVKTVLFDVTGHEVARHVCEYELLKPKPDFVEVDPDVYWHAACEGIRGIFHDSAVSKDDIVSVGVTSQGETLIVLDENGRPLCNAIVWLDNRAKAEAALIAEKFSRSEVYRITGQQEIAPAWTASKILWLRNHEPEIFKKVSKILLVEDYLIYRLTGEFATDHALNPSTLYYDMINGCWWREMLEFLKISEKQLPSLLNSGEIAGRVIADVGLNKNTPVTVAPIDQISAAVGAGNIAAGMITETTGCALAVCATTDKPVYDEKMRFGIYRHAVPGLYVMLPWIPAAGMILRWFRDEFGGGMDYSELCDIAINVPAGAEGLLLLPHFCGMTLPQVNPDAKGVFYGLTLSHKKRHFVRAIMESVAFSLRESIELLEQNGLKAEKIISMGGAARSRLWLQIKSDVLHRDFVTMACEESTCLGAAVLSAVGTGCYEKLNDAVNAMVHPFEVVMPENGQIYDSVFYKYKKLNGLFLNSAF
ncbi:MAG TPA: FGGY family carbohydrate kinase [Phycisphaerae bacterium]|nr:FGGY family carbohydrate kinase [Phycisphaerae bacterium]